MADPSTVPWWQELLLLAFGAGGGGGIVALLAEIRKISQNRTNQRLQDVFEVAGDLQAALAACGVAVSATRVLLLEAHNGGKDLDPHGAMYSSVRYEWTKGQVGAVRARWQHVLLDTAYVGLLNHILRKGHQHVVAAELPDDSQLRGVYEANGIAQSMVVLVPPAVPRTVFGMPWPWAKKRLRMHYVSVTWDDPGLKMTPSIVYHIDTCVTRCRMALEKIRIPASD